MNILFASGMKESQTMEIKLEDIPYPIFYALIEYLYTDTLTIGPDMALELLKLADRFSLNRLKQVCDYMIETTFDFSDLESIVGLLQIADSHQVHNLKNICIFLLAYDFGIDKVSKNNVWKHLSIEMKREIEELAVGITRTS